jgi:hypothetical protein
MKRIPLAMPAPGLRQQCENAAALLGFAVPCPTTLPLVKGKPIDCSDACVAMAGTNRVFFLNIDGYDPASKTIHHMIVEARAVDRVPPAPCANGIPAGSANIRGREVTVLECPNAAKLQGQIMHGEGAHSEHVLAYWDENGVRHAVSVHGATKPNTSLVQEVIASIEIVGS